MLRISTGLSFCFCLVTSLAPARAVSGVQPGLASAYPCDAGIESHPSVVFTEDFEEPTLGDMAGRWSDVSNLEGMSLVSDVPPASPGAQALQMTSRLGENTGGHLYKRLIGYDTLYARFYVKFAESCHPVHHFVHMGGYNPPTDWPQGGAGERPNGDDRFSSGIEPMGEVWRWDFYTYWMHMRGNPVPNTYWGNDFNPDPPSPVTRGEWTCVEVMMRCNDPLDSYSGEQAFWINGTNVIHLGEGFPGGYWIWDSFYPDPDSAPFEGYQWRFVDALDINWFWLLFYMTEGPDGQLDSVTFDDVVIATEYIGPLYPGVEEVWPRDLPSSVPLRLESFPNPVRSCCRIEYFLPARSGVELSVFDAAGRNMGTLFEGEQERGAHFVDWHVHDVPAGAYFVRLRRTIGSGEVEMDMTELLIISH